VTIHHPLPTWFPLDRRKEVLALLLTPDLMRTVKSYPVWKDKLKIKKKERDKEDISTSRGETGGKLRQTMVDSWYCLDRVVLEGMSQVSRRSQVENHKRRTLKTRLSSGTSSGTFVCPAGPYRNCRGEAGKKNEPKWYFVPIQKKGPKVDPHALTNWAIFTSCRIYTYPEIRSCVVSVACVWVCVWMMNSAQPPSLKQ